MSNGKIKMFDYTPSAGRGVAELDNTELVKLPEYTFNEFFELYKPMLQITGAGILVGTLYSFLVLKRQQKQAEKRESKVTNESIAKHVRELQTLGVESSYDLPSEPEYLDLFKEYNKPNSPLPVLSWIAAEFKEYNKPNSPLPAFYWIATNYQFIHDAHRANIETSVIRAINNPKDNTWKFNKLKNVARILDGAKNKKSDDPSIISLKTLIKGLTQEQFMEKFDPNIKHTELVANIYKYIKKFK